MCVYVFGVVPRLQCFLGLAPDDITAARKGVRIALKCTPSTSEKQHEKFPTCGARRPIPTSALQTHLVISGNVRTHSKLSTCLHCTYTRCSHGPCRVHTCQVYIPPSPTTQYTCTYTSHMLVCIYMHCIHCMLLDHVKCKSHNIQIEGVTSCNFGMLRS